jgi:4'-phosphopantetheinyl transferase
VAGVDVWWAAPAQHRADHLDLLGEAERERRERYRRDEDRVRFTVGVALLRLAVARTLEVPVAGVAIDRTCATCGEQHGRPRLPGDALHLSVSHSGDWVAVALTPTAPVGVDVEQVRPIDTAGMAGLVLAAGERADSLADFYRLWARKESVVKATGDGLRAPLAQVVLAPDGRVTGYPDRPDLTATTVDLAPRAGYAAALTVLAPSRPEIRERDGAEVLTPRPPR